MSQLGLELFEDVVLDVKKSERFDYRSVGGVWFKNLSIHEKVNFNASNPGNFDISCEAHKFFITEKFDKDALEGISTPFTDKNRREHPSIVKNISPIISNCDIKKAKDVKKKEELIKLRKQMFFVKWSKLKMHHKINVKMHQSFYLYQIHIWLLYDDIKDGLGLFYDNSQHGREKYYPTEKWYSKNYNHKII